MMTPHFFPVLPSALLMTVGEHIHVELTRRIARFTQWMETSLAQDILDVIPSYTTVLVVYDPDVITEDQMETRLREGWEQSGRLVGDADVAIITIPVVYGDEFGEDLNDVSRHTGLSAENVIARHLEPTYTVGALGFAPGFTYLVGLSPALETPRRDRPRLRVPAGSIGIGGAQTGIYALPTSGGWNLIGRTPERLFDPLAEEAVGLRMGDQVRFRQMDRSEWHEPESISAARDTTSGDGIIEVLSPGLQTTVQGPGRLGHGDLGFAPNGPADRASFDAANRAVGNPVCTPALEMTLVGPRLRFHRRLSIAVAGAGLGAMLNGLPLPIGRTQDVLPGDELSFKSPSGGADGMRAYLAVSGGINVPLVMGSASTDLTAGIGGHEGRALVAGDRLPVGARDKIAMGRPVPRFRRDDSPLRVMPGPQRESFSDETWDRLVSESFTVTSEANRVGIRLDGPRLTPLNGADIISEGIVTGSIQVTGEGQAIVMLPGHATIGGYTKIATVIEDDWDRLGQLVPGMRIRFREV
jgi:KipI family sensor histidine kinase inhibitor